MYEGERRTAHHLLVALSLMGAVIISSIATFRSVDRSLTSTTYTAIALGEVDDMDPSEQTSKWLRDTAGRRLSLYRAIGVVDGRRLLVYGDIVPDPQLLHGIARVDDVDRIGEAPVRSFADPSECAHYVAGHDEALGKYQLCLSDGPEIVMFKDSNLVVIQDASR